MNYIKKLEQDRSDLIAKIERIHAATSDLLNYAYSEKFQGEGALGTYISKNDVIARTQNILNEIN